MLCISLHITYYQRVFTFSASNDFGSCTDLGILTQNLCVQTQYFDFTFPMMRLHFANTCQIHHANSGSPTIRWCTTYLAICTGYEFFVSLRVTYVVLPSFHWTRTSTPFVVYLRHFGPVRILMKTSCSFTSVPSYLWSTISWNSSCVFTSPFIGCDHLSHHRGDHGFCPVLRIREGMGKI